MKDLLLISSLFLAFIACKGEEFSQKKAQDPYQRIEHLAQEKAQYQSRPAKNYQKVVVPAKLKYYYQSVDFTWYIQEKAAPRVKYRKETSPMEVSIRNTSTHRAISKNMEILTNP